MRSQDLIEEAMKVIPAGVTRSFRYFEPYPFYVEKAAKNKLYDVDGNEYIDFWMGHGALVLGHMHPVVVDAALEQVKLGFHFGCCHEWEVRLAEKIVKLVPSVEMVRFNNSGTEANIHAIRLARAYTKRDKVGKFEGGWHGTCDPLNIGVGWPLDELGAGLLESTFKNTVILPYNNLDHVRRVTKKDELACIILEPVQGSSGFIPAEKEFLEGLRELCDETNTLLIFDEVITGFRLAPGGGQEAYGVIPDITTFGKAVGSGELPVGAFGGRADIMELMDHLKHPGKANHVQQGGTYSGNPLVTRCGYAALKEFGKGYMYPKMDRLGEKARRGIEDAIEKSGVKAFVTGMGSMFKLHFTKERPKDIRTANLTRDPELDKEYFRYLVSHGVLAMTPSYPHFFVSLPHTEEDIERLISLTEDFLKSVKSR